MGVAVGDYDKRGLEDLTSPPRRHTLYETMGGSNRVTKSAGVGRRRMERERRLFDADNDGSLDLLVTAMGVDVTEQSFLRGKKAGLPSRCHRETTTGSQHPLSQQRRRDIRDVSSRRYCRFNGKGWGVGVRRLYDDGFVDVSSQ